MVLDDIYSFSLLSSITHLFRTLMESLKKNTRRGRETVEKLEQRALEAATRRHLSAKAQYRRGEVTITRHGLCGGLIKEHQRGLT
ncbi:hypothetical protein Peur_022766 [Populus x canadensis]